MMSEQNGVTKVVKAKLNKDSPDGRVRARHHALEFKVSGCCSRGSHQNCMSRNCVCDCHRCGR